jgi:hypothetical protein
MLALRNGQLSCTNEGKILESKCLEERESPVGYRGGLKRGPAFSKMQPPDKVDESHQDRRNPKRWP